MNRIKILLLSLVLSLALVACNSSENANQARQEDYIEEEYIEETDVELSKEEYDKLAYEDDALSVTLKSIEEVPEGKYVFNARDIIFELENKLDRDIVVQVNSLSVDGKMVNNSNIVSSTEIQAKKLADVYISISDEGGYEIPEVNENIEVNFRVFDWNDDSFEHEFKVIVDLD